MRPWAALMVVAALLAVAPAPDASAQTARDGKIRIIGRATVEAVPDYAIVRVGITNRAPTPTEALDQNSAIARKLIDFAKKFGVDEKDIGTASVTLTPVTRPIQDANGNIRQEPDGYRANNTVHVKLNEIPRVGTFMRDILDEGATNIAGVQFGLSNLEQVADDARAKAVANAFHQAQHLAAAAKIKLGAIQEIVHPPRVAFQRAEALYDMPAARLGSAAVPIEAGTVRVVSEVEITWTIQ